MATDESSLSEARSGYTIRGGTADADRLERQAEVMRSASSRFLARTGLRSGWACLDVGCGTGEVSLDLARMVGPTGRVVGIDTDGVALELAREAAGEGGVTAQFLCSDAAAPPEHAVFDLAFARLLLSHLADASAVLRAMGEAVHPGGVVAVEDLFTGTLRADPPEQALDRLQDIYSAIVRFHGGDPTIGPRLRALLSSAGLVEVQEETVTNLMRSTEQKLFIVELLDNTRDAILQAGVTDASELDEVRAAVDRAARSPRTVFHQARMHQVWGRRPPVGGR
jgi:ubiquinone/menaquinone biosynthesis C-methylase UbiE